MHIARLRAELLRRQRAVAYGYRAAPTAPQSRLRERFAAVRGFDCAQVLRALTGQAGQASGQTTRFCCPLHHDDTPSLVAYPGERGWYCFGCHAGGDAAKLVAEVLGIGLVAALILLESGELGYGTPAMAAVEWRAVRAEVNAARVEVPAGAEAAAPSPVPAGQERACARERAARAATPEVRA
ncbi:MAG: hypothetical protein KC442_16020 [Thermomicrobiales bacterium]|nr:hypothetical protein [Thermomicrobiales bacterium]